MTAPALLDWKVAGRTLRLGERPWLMGVVNATPDSFSDTREHSTLDARVELAREMVAAGAQIVDVGGESGITNRPAVEAQEEIARVAPLIQRLAGEGMLVSVDTYKPAVARAALDAGAAIVNDVSGLLDLELAEVCAEHGAGLVLTHTRAQPKVKVLDHDYAPAGGVSADIVAFLEKRMAAAQERGVEFDSLMLDSGPDFAKTPAQTIEALRNLEELHALGRPLLLAISRKDFVGALTGRPPRERLAGTLAALADGIARGGHVFRVHDVAACADFLAVRAALSGQSVVAAGLELAEGLRREPAG